MSAPVRNWRFTRPTTLAGVPPAFMVPACALALLATVTGPLWLSLPCIAPVPLLIHLHREDPARLFMLLAVGFAPSRQLPAITHWRTSP